MESAEAVAKIKNIRDGKEDIEMTAHLTMPEGGRALSYRINLELREEQIHKALDNPRNPTYTAVRRLGKTSESVIINFKDLEVPNAVKLFCQWIPCHLYKKKYDVCNACGKIRHRQDVCPDPRSTRCSHCGLSNQPEEHACEPKCLLCGKKHQLGDLTCRALYRKPNKKREERPRAEAGRHRRSRYRLRPKSNDPNPGTELHPGHHPGTTRPTGQASRNEGTSGPTLVCLSPSQARSPKVGHQN
ncbi:hypothetical protein HPB49_021508 [Dermacentor silvarum]|uniref:Uncharacterized protein n=1 Tax=Dermacentor silvarum TaxID=543639 RepID=A0ACB8D8A3_DERSI|nr:hypothetical protein HPB49_021508 [Dermacentor silvarum]